MASPRQDEVNLPVMRARWEHDAEEDVAAPGRSRSTLDLTQLQMRQCLPFLYQFLGVPYSGNLKE